MLDQSSVRRLSGFGMNAAADAYVLEPDAVEQIWDVFEIARRSGRRVVLRGSGRSYGDAAIAPEQLALDIGGMNRILQWDPQSGVLEAEAGATLGDLWRTTIGDGWWLPVVSGTMHPTLAGALAMNIHGKNNFRAGTLGEHVLELEVATVGGQSYRLTPSDEDFYRVISGAGLLAIITRAKIQMHRVPSGDVLVRADSCAGWDEQFACFQRDAESSDYMVSWIDCFGSGRGLYHSARYDPNGRSPSLEGQQLPSRILGLVPKSQVWRVLRLLNRRPGMKALNAAKYHAGRLLEHGKTHRQSLAEYSFLLDFVPGWEKSYQPEGFIQYQSFVPADRAKDVFAEQLAIGRAEKMESFLGVLKRHRPDPFLLSHAVDGYSLALDFKITDRKRLWAMCRRMNDLVLQAGGRFYLAKDSTLRPTDLSAYLGEDRLREFRETKARLDPEGLLTSSLGVRLGLAPPLASTGSKVDS